MMYKGPYFAGETHSITNLLVSWFSKVWVDSLHHEHTTFHQHTLLLHFTLLIHLC